ncbi:DNA-directed RNA polymerase sigma-70 factor [Mycobacterium parmense]|uniref:DNA-directed RNA polymerase sigma-70 factor n=2 Tax=Mycobacterium parmense TaxID=185642 RepID=A0A7I7YR98_9MYCO|nr:DNA-directed RNA polymerase sigma-70 factor [Mycobacterium parmense]
MLGSIDDAQDAVQEAWLRLAAAEPIANLDAWLTTVVARICLNTLRARRGREQTVARLPDPIVQAPGECDPEHRAMLADAVGMALFVVLDTLPPAERLAFVLHDVFTVPFDQIAAIVDRTPQAARKLASRARRRIRDADPTPDGDIAAQRQAVDAFFAAGRSGDFHRLVSVLDPDVVLRGDFGGAAPMFRADGAPSVARVAGSYAGPEREVRAAIVNGAAGALVLVGDHPTAIMGFVVRGGRVAAIDVLADPARISRIDLSALTG